MKTVAVTTSSFAVFSEEPLRLLRERGLEIKKNPHGRALDEAEAKEFLAGCVGVVAGTEPLTETVFAALPGLRAVSRCGVGLDSVDMAAATRHNVLVANTPDAPTTAVAELTLGLTLALLRHICELDRDIRAGKWKKRMGTLLCGKKTGIVGLGRIGRAVRERFDALGAQTAYADPFVSDAPGRMELEALLGWADIVTLHLPKTREGVLLDARRLGLLRPDAYLINCARGGLVDEQALAAALEAGRLAGAAVDVFAREPYEGPLAALANVILTPHVGSYAREARVRMETDAARNLVALLEKQGAL